MDHEDRYKFKMWISIADAWNTQPKQLYFETYNTGDLPERIVEHVQNRKPKKVFITRNLRDTDYLSRALKGVNYSIEGKSLIEFKQITIKELPKTDWIFFSSKHSVKYFFNQKPKIEN